MENRAHGESKEKRLERFKKNPPVEVIETLLNSLNNYFNNIRIKFFFEIFYY